LWKVRGKGYLKFASFLVAVAERLEELVFALGRDESKETINNYKNNINGKFKR